MGNSCNCRLNCFHKISLADRQKLFDNFNKLPSKDLQDSYLCLFITVTDVARKRQRMDQQFKPKSISCKFTVKDGVKNFQICKNALLAIHGIKKGRIDRIINHLKNNATPPTDLRGRHYNRPNKISQDIVDQIHNHILSFPKYKSHYSRNDNLSKYYLSPLLNVAKLHMLYLEKHEPIQYRILQENGTNENFKPVVQYEFFRKYFTENFNITFGSPKSDTCQKCDKLIKQIDSADTEDEKNRLQTEESLHVSKAQTFYEKLKDKSELSKTTTHVEVITFNFQQNFPLPVSSSGDVFYKIQMWVYTFCIHVASTGKSYFFLYDETIAGKGQNEVISLLHYFFKHVIRPEVTDLYMFSDNCASQNKLLLCTSRNEKI
ncbi:uncharacterized protein [Onthophagus taurus]|uniref:uncharacterized protein n=1 Tax=Onthophagus taurus TaxID=166361 RepID=UPI0039BE2EA1